MDQGWATVIAAVLALGGGTLLGGMIEARRADSRIKADREWQREQLDRLWKRENELATTERVRATRLRRLLSTRDFMLAALNQTDPPGGSVVAAIRDLDGPSIGDPELVDELKAAVELPNEDRKKAVPTLSVRLIQAAAAQEERILRE